MILRLCVFMLLWCNTTSAQDWTQFRGQDRDGKSPETGLLKQWPESGPKLLHTISGFGSGFSSPVIAGDRIYISGKVFLRWNDNLYVYDISGRI